MTNILKSNVSHSWNHPVRLMLLSLAALFLSLCLIGSSSELDFSRISVKKHANGTLECGEYLQVFMRPRIPGSPASLEIQQYLLNFFADLGWTSELDHFIHPIPKNPYLNCTQLAFTNLIFSSGTEREKVVLAAHYDSKIIVNPKTGLNEFIGATDSAWSCALLLELARTVRKPRNYDLQIIFFDGEEAINEWNAQDSKYGSRHLAEKWSRIPGKLESIHLFILLDLLGSAEGWILSHFQESHEDYLAMARLDRKRRFFDPSQIRVTGGVADDDHEPFMRLGVPILHLIPVPFPSVWHTLEDDQS